MAECKDCVHFCVCSPWTAPNESYPEVGGCPAFQDGEDNDVPTKWISVEDRLPEKEELVLCIGKRGGMFLGEIHPFLVGRERNEVYCDVPNSRQGRYAIYWMPLPQPPKGE